MNNYTNRPAISFTKQSNDEVEDPYARQYYEIRQLNVCMDK